MLGSENNTKKQKRSLRPCAVPQWRSANPGRWANPHMVEVLRGRPEAGGHHTIYGGELGSWECRVQGNQTLTCFLKQVPNFSGLASNRFRAFRGKNHPQPVPVSVSRRKRDLTSCALPIALNHDDVTCIPTTPWKAPSCFKTSCAPLELFFHSALIIQ